MSGTDRIPQLEKKAKEFGVQIYTETRGTEILMGKNGKVSGAKAVQTDGTQITINASKGVVLATGGYCANPTMFQTDCETVDRGTLQSEASLMSS